MLAKSKIELEYTNAKIYKRLFASFIDFFTIFLSTFIFFSLTNMVLPQIDAYKNLVEEKSNLLVESGLYNNELTLVLDVVQNDEEFSTAKEKGDYLKKSIDGFYESIYFFTSEESQKIKEDYNERKVNYVVDDTHIFSLDGENIVENPVNPQYFYDFYVEEINNYSLPFLNQNEEIINANKILSITSYVSFSIWLLLFVLFFELFFPLVVFKRGRLTLGRKVFSIGLIDVNALNIKTSKYLGRVAFIVIVMYVIGFFSFLLPLFVSLGMMFISKRHQDLVDYVFNTYVVDIKKDEIYLDQLDFLDKTNKDKKVKLEDKDLTITNWF